MTPSPSSTPVDLAELLSRLEQGDIEARNRLIEKCQEQFNRRARQMLASYPALIGEVTSSDVEQELYVYLCSKLAEANVKDARHFLRLANLTIRHFLIDLARKRKTRLTRETRSALLQSNTPPVSPLRQAMLEEIHVWIGTLPEVQQELFNLIFYQEMSQEEAGQVMNLSRKVVMRMVRELKLDFIQQFGASYSGFLC